MSSEAHGTRHTVDQTTLTLSRGAEKKARKGRAGGGMRTLQEMYNVVDAVGGRKAELKAAS